MFAKAIAREVTSMDREEPVGTRRIAGFVDQESVSARRSNVIEADNTTRPNGARFQCWIAVARPWAW
jgi:hypothetical protein